MPRICIVQGDDWAGLYLDGKLVYEGHSIHAEHIFKALSIEWMWCEADYSWLDQEGSLPADMNDVRITSYRRLGQ